MPIAVIAFDFDPLLRLTEGLVVRWQTLGLAALVFGVLLVVALRARASGRRPDDALAIAVGAVPGAVIGGRATYAVIRPDAFAAGPATLLDPAVGGLELAGGVVGGLLTAGYVAALLGAPLGAWARLSAVPVLVVLGGGKIVMALGGSGQGLPSEAPWATAYLGPGPWGSLAADLPSHPAQLYEGVGTLLWATVLVVLLAVVAGRGGPPSRRLALDGRTLLVGIAGWALIRAAVSATWRDPAGPPPLPAAGWLAILVALGSLIAVAVLTARRQVLGSRGGHDDVEPLWPDPATRPPF